MRVGVAGVPGAWSSERMCEALRAEGMESFVFSLSDCVHDLNRGRVMLYDFDLSTLDGVVVKKLGEQPSRAARLRLHMLRQLQDRGVRIFSRPSAVDIAMDRYRMSMGLISAGLPMPQTYAVESEATLSDALEQLGQAVAKPVYTSKARGMARIARGAGRSALDSECVEGRILLQQFVESSGRDIGACVLGGRFIGAFYRVAADGEWITSTSAGGRYAPCTLTRPAIALAEDAADVFGLDYTVVDLVETGDGYSIYEVSAFGGFRGLWEASRYDVASEYARYIRWDLQP